MKKLLFILAISCSLSGFGQSFSMGNNNISAGYGIGNIIQSIFSSYETYDSYSFKATGPFFLKYEQALTDRLGIGINAAYVGAKVSYIDKSYIVDTTSMTFYKQTINWSSYSILARLNFHFATLDKLDPYWGFGIGYRGASWKASDNDPNYDNSTSFNSVLPIGFEATIGARYYFTPAIGAYMEVGIAKAVVQFGLSANLY
jgi:opacity protein-like surface antigen